MWLNHNLPTEMEGHFNSLSRHWDEQGFFGLLRDRQLKFDLGQEVLNILKEIDFTELDFIPKKYISLLWFIPLFMEWQSRWLLEEAKKSVIYEYTNLQNMIDAEIQRILGVP